MSRKKLFGQRNGITQLDISKLMLVLGVLMLVISSFVTIVDAQPTGASISSNVTQTVSANPAGSLTTAGGSFTRLVLNGTFQTQKWKAYVGNVTGKISLDDGSSNTIYDWDFAAPSGQVYVVRNSSIDWTTAVCADSGAITAEHTFLNINASRADSINNTFNETIHRSFFVGTQPIVNSTCPAIATYINDSKQTPNENANFQEILIKDTNDNVAFVTILENSIEGFDTSPYDFQIIVPEDETSGTPTTYYFYVELN